MKDAAFPVSEQAPWPYAIRSDDAFLIFQKPLAA